MYAMKSYIEAKTTDEVIEELKKNPNALIISGGTDVLIKARELKAGFTDRDLIGISRIPDIHGIRLEGNGDIFIGATTTFTEIENNEIIQNNISSLGLAVGTVGGPQIRNIGTIGGNVCNGATSGDSGSTLVALNAVVLLKSSKGERELPISEFYVGPGKVSLYDDEICLGFRISKEDYTGYKGHYIKFAQRKAMDIATLGCSVWLKEKDGTVEDLRIAYGVAGPTPMRASKAEAFAKGKKLTDEFIEELGNKCLEDTNARDSWRASKAFREQLIVELPKRAIRVSLGGE